MKGFKTLLFVIVSIICFASVSIAAEFGTPEEAEAMVKKAVALIKTQGKDKAFVEISNPKGKFIDRDLYIFVYDLNGKCVAHGFNQKMIGVDLIDMKDPDGKLYVKERVEIAKTKGKGWQDYKFTNPTSKKVEHKRAYIEKVDDYIVGCGIYKF
ncbi:MAG TPA: cache domain-containing protein [Syntrophorhabdaceae bacterium]|nr:cache domain-containing protein [Syntrophorhabdaceae bacterium]